MLTSLFLKLTFLGAEWIMWLLLLLSVISIALIVERVLYFLRTRVDMEQLTAQLQEQLRAGNLQGAWQLVHDSESMECGVVAAGLMALRNGPAACSEAMQSTKARLRPALDQNLSLLATIGSNAPFIGLLGTVLGIVKAAHDLTANASQNNPERRDGRRLRGARGHGGGAVCRHPGRGGLQYAATPRAQGTVADGFARTSVARFRAFRHSLHFGGGDARYRHTSEGRVMAANASSGFADEDDDSLLSNINVTPMVDVTLVLLIVFMITVPAIVGSAPVKVQLPESTSVPAASEQLPLIFSLKREGGELVFYINERRTNEEDLRKLFGEMGTPAEDQQVSLSADRDISYGEVVHFMDLLHSLGLKKLSLDTRHVESR